MRLRHLLAVAILGFLFAPGAHAQGAPCTVSANAGFFVPNIGNVSNWGLCLNADINALDSLLAGTATLAGNSTPSVTGFTNWVTANTGTTTITNLTGGFQGQLIRLICGNSDTFTQITGSGTISVLASWACSSSSSISFVLVGSIWKEVTRSFGTISGVALLASPNTFTSTNHFTSTSQFDLMATFVAGISADGIHPELIPANTSTLVDLSFGQTLTNKTLTAPVITGGTMSSPTITTPTVNGATFTSSLIFTGASGSLASLTAGTGILGTAQAFTAAQTFSAAANLNAGGALVGTFTGNHTESGNTNFSGTPSFTGAGTTGVLTAGNGLLATFNTWTATQAFTQAIQATGYATRNGTAGSYDGHSFNIYYGTAGPAHLYVDTTDLGVLTINDATQTLNNKTITSPLINGTPTGTTGNMTAGNGLLGNPYSWSAVQTFASPVLNTPTLGGETISHSPRMLFTGAVVNGSVYGSTDLVIAKIPVNEPITITDLYIAIQQTANCSSQPRADLQTNNLGSVAFFDIPNGVTEGSQTVSVNVAAGDFLVIHADQGPVTCVLPPLWTLTVQYKMQ